MTRTSIGIFLLVWIAIMHIWSRVGQSGYAVVSWQPVTQDVNSVEMRPKDIWRYQIYKRATTNAAWSLTAYAPGDVCAVMVPVTDGTTNQYCVSAVNWANQDSGKSTNINFYAPAKLVIPSGVAVTNWNEPPL